MKLVLLILAAAVAALAQDGPLADGIQAFKRADYKSAQAAFERAVAAEPGSVTAHLYLGTALMSQYIPGANTSEIEDLARRAEAEFETVARLDPRNLVALQSLASLAYNQAQGLRTVEEKLPLFEKAAVNYRRVTDIDPQNKEAHYSLGVIGWAKFYPGLMEARAKLGMKPEMPGPLPDPAVRADLFSRYGAEVDEAMAHLKRALEIDPEYDDAMAYMNLLVRERADLVDSPDEYKRQVAVADEWVRKALETKREKAEHGLAAPSIAFQSRSGGGGGGGDREARRLRVGSNVMASKLLTKVDPEYPPLARQACIQGTVRFSVVIGKGGHMQELTLVSGHPLLVEPAQQAVRQWAYEPTLLNGNPVEVVTTIDVNFTLTP